MSFARKLARKMNLFSYRVPAELRPESTRDGRVFCCSAGFTEPTLLIDFKGILGNLKAVRLELLGPAFLLCSADKTLGTPVDALAGPRRASARTKNQTSKPILRPCRGTQNLAIILRLPEDRL
jgi:hypothetical protein